MNVIKQVKYLMAFINYESKNNEYTIMFVDLGSFEQETLSIEDIKDYIMLTVCEGASPARIDSDSMNNLIIDTLKTTHTLKSNYDDTLYFINNSINCEILHCEGENQMCSICDNSEHFIVVTYNRHKNCVEYLNNKYNVEKISPIIFYLTKKPFLTKRAIK